MWLGLLPGVPISHWRSVPMIRICTAIALALSLSFPVPGFAQSVIPGFGGTDLTINGVPGGANQVPGGLTLVPGTVAIPGVSGAANTGTIPLPGTTGAPGIPMIIDPVSNYPGNAGT